MNLIKLSITIALCVFPVIYNSAQEINISGTIDSLEASKERVIKEEKEALKKEVVAINEQLDNEEITMEQANELKSEAAEKHALNIENRIAIIDNKIALLKRNKNETTGTLNDNKVVVEFFDEGEFINISVGKKKKFDRRTTSKMVVAFGLNNLITKGKSFNDTDYEIGGSRFFELGWAWKTRVFKESNWLRIKYGFSFQWDGLKPTDNLYFVDTGEVTELQLHPERLDKAKLRVDKLVFPVHFEFGPSKKIERDDYFRFTSKNQLKVGLGGYAGLKMSSRQKLKYSVDGNNTKEKIKASYNTNNVIYGLSGYIGRGCTALYVKYDLNPIFKDNPVDQHNISMGLRFDM
jgi:hypothetical protein